MIRVFSMCAPLSRLIAACAGESQSRGEQPLSREVDPEHDQEGLSMPINEIRPLALGVAVLFAWGGSAAAEPVRYQTDAAVAQAADAVEAAATARDATIFARIDHGSGAEQAGLELRPSILVVFGNPMVGTPVMQEDILAGLRLPLRMLAYQDETGQVWIAHDGVEALFDGVDVDPASEAAQKIAGALAAIAEEAAAQ
jgi:uncharacterized protein (DUF302 family)